MNGTPEDTLLRLRPYQAFGAAFLTEREAALLADEMGLGKTIQTIAAVRTLRETGKASRVLLICPSPLRLNWTREFARWAPDIAARPIMGDQEDRSAYYGLPIPVLIASYEQVRVDFRNFQGIRPFDLVILDEAQRIKNPSAETSLACRLVARHRAWALTGTPVENRVEDLLSIYRFLAPGLLHVGLNRSAIHEGIADTFLRRRKVDVLPELPPIIIQDLLIDLTDSQRAAYDALWQGTRDGLGEAASSRLLAVITNLKQLCNRDPVSDESVKLDTLTTLLESVRGETGKVIVFSQFVETLTWLADKLPLPSDLLHGGQSEATRDDVLSRFTNHPGPRVLLASLRAAGVGLNIQAAEIVVLFDRWWNPAVEDQAIARAHRFGRQAPLHVVRLLTSHTIEESIAQLLDEKRQLFANLVENAPQAQLDRSDLLNLLQLQSLDPGGSHGQSYQSY